MVLNADRLKIIRRMGFLKGILILFGMIVFINHAHADESTLYKAIQFYKTDQIDRADSLFQIIWHENDQNAEAAFYRGRIAFVREDFKEATQWFEAAITIADTSAQYHYWLGNSFGMQAMKAGIIDKISLAKKTKTSYEKAIELNLDFLDARWGLLQYLTLAPGIMGGGDDKAIIQAEEIQKLNPIQGVYAYGFFYKHKGDQEKLESVYQQGIASYPDETGFYLPLYQIYMEEKSFDHALNLTVQFIQRHPDHIEEGWLYQVYIHQEKKEYTMAKALLDSILIKNPDHMMAHYQVGRTAVYSGEFLEAGIKSLNIYLQHEPAKDEPQWTHAYFRLGQIYEKAGDLKLARDSFEKALNLDPENKEAKKALEAMKSRIKNKD